MPKTIRIEAPVVVLSPSEVCGPGHLLIKDGRIVGFDDQPAQSADIVLRDCAILPGLLNCHTHLEFSDLAEPIVSQGDFTDWIGAVVAHRRKESARVTASDYASMRRTAVRKGMREMLRGGTVLACDIVTPPWEPSFLEPFEAEWTGEVLGKVETSSGVADVIQSHSDVPSDDLRVIPMGEWIGLDRARSQESFDWAVSLCQNTAPAMTNAISPHSPYSLLFPFAGELASHLPSNTMLAMHVAESPAEMQWLESRSGPMKDAFDRIGVPVPAELPTIDVCLDLLAASSRSLVVHGNYLNDAQLHRIATCATQSLVFCPRTHSHFGHAAYPLMQALDAGVRVVLGTDSRASNPDLSMWSELAQVGLAFPGLSVQEIFAMATTRAADALGIANDYGSLFAGRLVKAAVVTRLAGEDKQTLLSQLFSDAGKRQFVSLAAVCRYAARSNAMGQY